MRLSKKNYGSIIEINSLDIGTFWQLVQYEQFLDEYETQFRALNEK